MKVGVRLRNKSKGVGLKNGLFVRVTQEEALRLIQSLAEQLVKNNPNDGRLESYPKGDFDYFTIGVLQRGSVDGLKPAPERPEVEGR
jgi:hypothetical protein